MHSLASIAVFKFVEHPENNEKPLDKCKVKFKIVSLKVKGPVEYVPELVNPISTSPVRLIMDVILDRCTACFFVKAITVIGYNRRKKKDLGPTSATTDTAECKD